MLKPATSKAGRLFSWISLGLAIFAGCKGPPARPDGLPRGDLEVVRDYAGRLIRYEMKRAGIKGLSIALVDDQEVAWASAYGFADEAAGIVAAPDTVYRAGSLAKLFTAAAALRLVEEGRLDLDRPLEGYVPQFSVRTRFQGTAPITPRLLLTHHSGLPADRLRGMWTAEPEPFTRVAGELRDEYVAHPPNVVFSHSNVGFTLVGHAIENASGEAYSAYVERSIVQPLGMTPTSVSASPRVPGMAKAYEGGREADEPPLRDVPAGGLNTTVLDLSRFVQMVFGSGKWKGGRILRSETVAEMLRPQNEGTPLDLDHRVGLGWFLDRTGEIDIRNAGTVAHHAGAGLFHRGLVVLLLEHRLAAVLLSNSRESSPILGRIAAQLLTLARSAKTGVRQPTEEEDAADDPLPAEPSSFGNWIGSYATVVGLVTVGTTGAGHRAEMLGRSFRLIPRGDDQYGLRYSFLGVIPGRQGQLNKVRLSLTKISGHELLVARSGGRKTLAGERIVPVEIPESWKERLGAYEIANRDADVPVVRHVAVRQRDGFLVLELTAPLLFAGPKMLALAPVSDTEAVVLGLDPNSGETVRVTHENGADELVYSGYVLKRKHSG